MKNRVKLVGTSSGIKHGICKVNKDINDNRRPFQSILSKIKSPTYKLAIFKSV